MSAALLPLFVAVPLLAAGLAACAVKLPVLTRSVMVLVLVANLAAAITAVALTADGSAHAHQVGLWEAGVSIPLAVDAFSALMLTVAGFLTLVSVLFGLQTDTGRHRLFPILLLVLQAGVNGALLTGDIFNLFVFIEVMLLPSYGLLVMTRSGAGTVRSVVGTRLYVTFNLFVSTLFLTGVALTYGVAGTVNLGELAGRAVGEPLVAAAVGVALFALSMKAAVVPVHGWLARTYPMTSPAITGLFSALHTKVAIYAIYRIYAVVFEGDQRYLWIGVVLFSATMLIGVLGAVGEGRMRSILAFHMVSQIGYILLGVALFTQAGLTAGIAYLLHHMIVKSSLFLSAGAIEERYGTDELDRLRGRMRREPLLALAFAGAALSLAGIPPLSGFFAKFTLIVAAFDAGQVAAAVIAVIVSLITLLSMLKIFNAVFSPAVTGEEPELLEAAEGDPAGGDDASRSTGRSTSPGDDGSAADPAHGSSAEASGMGSSTAVATLERRVATAQRSGTPMRLILPALVLAACSLSLGLGAQFLLELSGIAAAGLLDTSTFVEAVTR